MAPYTDIGLKVGSLVDLVDLVGSSQMRGIAGLIRCWSIWMMEHWGSGALGYWCTLSL